MKKRNVVMNLKPTQVAIEVNSYGFTLTFSVYENGRIKKVNLIFGGYWWVRIIAIKLWEVIKRQQREIQRNECAMRDSE